MHRQVNRLIDRYTDKWADEETARWRDRLTDEWKDRRINGKTSVNDCRERLMDRQMSR